MAKSPRKLAAAIVVSSLVGVALSAYAVYVGTKLEEDENYEAVCDISEYVSCSKVFKSEYVIGSTGFSSFYSRSHSRIARFFYSILQI